MNRVMTRSITGIRTLYKLSNPLQRAVSLVLMCFLENNTQKPFCSELKDRAGFISWLQEFNVGAQLVCVVCGNNLEVPRQI